MAYYRRKRTRRGGRRSYRKRYRRTPTGFGPYQTPTNALKRPSMVKARLVLSTGRQSARCSSADGAPLEYALHANGAGHPHFANDTDTVPAGWAEIAPYYTKYVVTSARITMRVQWTNNWASDDGMVEFQKNPDLCPLKCAIALHNNRSSMPRSLDPMLQRVIFPHAPKWHMMPMENKHQEMYMSKTYSLRKFHPEMSRSEMFNPPYCARTSRLVATNNWMKGVMIPLDAAYFRMLFQAQPFSYVAYNMTADDNEKKTPMFTYYALVEYNVIFFAPNEGWNEETTFPDILPPGPTIFTPMNEALILKPVDPDLPAALYDNLVD